MAARIVPLFNRVLVQRAKVEAKSVGGILLPEKSVNRNNEGTVLAVGPGKDSKPCAVAVGQKVLLPEFGGSKIKVGEEEMFLFHDDDILAIVKD
eukprot:a2261_514.p3 GENE.a2261_514~~a2261_514.p3  ORF type:complete len:105 (-),score=57.61 a2261_514:44-325(-)